MLSNIKAYQRQRVSALRLKTFLGWLFGWFSVPTEGEKKLLLEQENLDSVLKSIST